MKIITVSVLLIFSTSTYAGDNAELNKKIALSVFEALTFGDVELLNNLFAPEGTTVIGSEERKRGGPFDTFAEAAPFPAALDERDIKIEKLISEENTVVVQSRICGIHARELVGYEPTKKRICARYTNIYSIENGRIIENVVGFDRQLRRTLESNSEGMK